MMDQTTIINVRYGPGFNHELDAKIREITACETRASGYYIPTGERDLQFEVMENDVARITIRLKLLGVRVETPWYLRGAAALEG